MKPQNMSSEMLAKLDLLTAKQKKYFAKSISITLDLFHISITTYA